MVGLGPGDKEFIAPAAIEAITQAEVIVGYKTYVDLIEDMISDKQVLSSGMRQEVARAQVALEQAIAGKHVAVVSSGDPGVYGMAGILLQLAEEQSLQLQIDIVPGITAVTVAAAALGAPLMHDFAVISLSDLLTPWDTICRRLEAAGMADFVVAIYNPKSKGRAEHFAAAREILLKHRGAQTPVGIVRNAKRGEESVVVTTLEDCLDCPIDMLTTVIIGNSETKILNGKIVTPRGYRL